MPSALPDFKAGALRKDEREHAKYECKRRHENRSKSQPTSLNRRINVIFAFSCCCFANSTISTAFFHARPTNTTNPIWVMMLLSISHPHTCRFAKQTHWNDEDDNERKSPALIFSRVR